MRHLLKRATVVTVAFVALLALSTIPATAAVGQRIASADGDTVNECLDWAGAGTLSTVQMWACNGGAQQNWRYVQRTDLGSNVWEIRSRMPGGDTWCVSARYGHGKQVGMEPCASFYFQLWVRHNHTSTWHSWESYDVSGQCLDVKDHGTSPVVWLYGCLMNQGNQRWKMY